MNTIDIVLLTDPRYVAPKTTNDYTRNVLLEDRLIREALEKRGFRVDRRSWDDKEFNWSNTKFALFRSTWDYFDRLPEFLEWFEQVRQQTRLINTASTIEWNIDKHYLKDLANNGVHIPATIFIEEGDQLSLSAHVGNSGWEEVILKPAISGAARHTYKFKKEECGQHESIFKELIASECMLLQEFQSNVVTRGEVAFMIFGGKYSHAILKVAKPGDFRVQDDFGGSIHNYTPGNEEIEFAENAVAACSELPVYARVDVIIDNHGRMAVSELELLEPELWMRKCDVAAELFADAIAAHVQRSH